MAYRWLSVLLLSAACAAGCGDGATGGPRGAGGDGGTGTGATGGNGTGGTAGAGGSTPACERSALCRSCPTDATCGSNGDCSVGFVCIESGCDDLGGTPIKQCVFAGGGACQSTAMCAPGRECRDVPMEGKRCIKTTPGCDTSFDCVLGFECESGVCVDRRIPCSLDANCPKNHTCGGTATSNFCLRIQIDCLFDFDCVDRAPGCEDIDGDGNKECAGVFDPNQSPVDTCLNSECGSASAPVCESAGSGPLAACGQYGLCLDSSDCAAGFSCVGLWPDGRKECVPAGGDCSSSGDCGVREICASPREGGPTGCQKGLEL